MGAEVVVATAYETVLPEEEKERVRKVLQEGVDLITFTSSSTAKNLLRMLDENSKKHLSKVVLASIGPITSQTLKEAVQAPDPGPRIHHQGVGPGNPGLFPAECLRGALSVKNAVIRVSNGWDVAQVVGPGTHS
jgi:hypothetical protein